METRLGVVTVTGFLSAFFDGLRGTRLSETRRLGLGFTSFWTASTTGVCVTTALGGGDICTDISSKFCLDDILDVLSLTGAGESTPPSLFRIRRGEGLGAISTGISTEFFSLDARLNNFGRRDGELGGDFVDVGGDAGGDFGDTGGD